MGILDTIIHNKQSESLSHFKPSDVVKEILDLLKERDRRILIHRYGLEGSESQTLAAIGQEQNLTRERVRQIEKDLLKNLKKSSLQKESFISAKDFLLNIVAEHGRIIAEESLLMHLNIGDDREKNALIFILHLIEELDHFIHLNYKKAWVSVLFKQDLLSGFVNESKKIIGDKNSPLPAEEFLQHFKETDFYKQNQAELSDRIILNYLELTVEIEKNVFGHWGLTLWKEVKPKDVGDKAYLVMKHHKKPEHYSAITEMINKAGFDERKAYKETVHNELIKDQRFILIGRGIYALSEWGYKPGVVADVIIEILKQFPQPMPKEKIIEEVLKRRMVKKNTILVGLSNKKLFLKVGKNSYSLVQ
jgi:Sigma-70, region 4